MKFNISTIFTFAVGALIGSAVTWKCLNKKYEQMIQEETKSTKSVKDLYYKKLDDLKRVPDPDADVKKEYQEAEEAQAAVIETQENGEYSMGSNYRDILTNMKYGIFREGDDGMPIKAPYVITPDEFGDRDGYDVVSLNYYADGVLATDWDEVIESIDDIVGEESLEHFGQYEKDSVFVRNDRLKADYEILRDLRNYSDVVGNSPNDREDE